MRQYSTQYSSNDMLRNQYATQNSPKMPSGWVGGWGGGGEPIITRNYNHLLVCFSTLPPHPTPSKKTPKTTTNYTFIGRETNTSRRLLKTNKRRIFCSGEVDEFSFSYFQGHPDTRKNLWSEFRSVSRNALMPLTSYILVFFLCFCCCFSCM